MSKDIKPSAAGSVTASPSADAATPSKPTKKKAERFHVVRGIPYPVVRTFFDRRQNAVIDVIKVVKVVPNKFGGEPKRVTIHRHVYCRDEALQAKYAVKQDATVEVNLDVE